jgi:hypothetical protein
MPIGFAYNYINDSTNIKDTYVIKSTPNSNYNTDPKFDIGKYGTDYFRGYLLINFSSIASDSVNESYLYLYNQTTSGGNTLTALYVDPNTFNITTVTWNNQPCGVDTTNFILNRTNCEIFKSGIIYNSTWNKIDITNITNMALLRSDKLAGIYLQVDDNTLGNNFITIYSRDTGLANKPYIKYSLGIPTNPNNSTYLVINDSVRIKDTFVDSNSSILNDMNYKFDTGYFIDVTVQHHYRNYINIDLHNITGTINTAILYLYPKSCNTPFVYDVHEGYNYTWIDDYYNWTNQPCGMIINDVNASCNTTYVIGANCVASQYQNLTITDIIIHAYTGNKIANLLIMGDDETISNKFATIYSRDTGLNYKPYLILLGTGLSTNATTTTIPTTSTTIIPHISDYWNDTASALVGTNAGAAGSLENIGRYFTGLIILVIFSILITLSFGFEIGVIAAVLLTLVLSLINLLPVVIAYIIIIISAGIIAKIIYEMF